MNKKIIAVVMLAFGCIVTKSRAQKALPPSSHASLPPGILGASSERPPLAASASVHEKEVVPSWVKANVKDRLEEAPGRLKGALVSAVRGNKYERIEAEEPSLAEKRGSASGVPSNVQWKKTAIMQDRLDAHLKKIDDNLKRDRELKEVAKTSPEMALIAVASNARDEAQMRMNKAKERLDDAQSVVNAGKSYLTKQNNLKTILQQEEFLQKKIALSTSTEDSEIHNKNFERLKIERKKAEDAVDKARESLEKQLDGRSIKAVQAEVAAAKKQIKAEEDQIKQADRIVTAASDRTKINNTIPMLEEKIAENKELLKTGTPEEKRLAAQGVTNYKKLLEENKKDLKEAEKILATEKLPTSKKTESSGVSTKKKVAIGAAVGITGLAGVAGLAGAVGAAGGISALSEDSSAAAPSEEKDADQGSGEAFEVSPASEG